MHNLAPIVLFAYNRPEHTLKCLESLAENNLAAQSVLHIFCDGPKANASPADLQKIKEVHEVVNRSKWCGEVFIHTQEKNIGLRNSIISGVTSIISKHGKVIVIEDDLVLSRYFLEYMNNGLKRYEQNLNVGQISGFAFKLDVTSVKEDAYFIPLATTWGWATWGRVWDEVDFDGRAYQSILPDKKTIRRFNLDNSYDYYSMLMKQLKNDQGISSWGIMFWLNAFKHQYMVLYPKHALCTNNGFDGSGRHNSDKEIKDFDDFSPENRVTFYPENVASNEAIFSLLKHKLAKQEYSFTIRILKMIRNIMVRLGLK